MPVVTILSAGLLDEEKSKQIRDLMQAYAQITSWTPQEKIAHSYAVKVEISPVAGNAVDAISELKSRLYEFSDALGVDIILQNSTPTTKLAVFDMDSTLIQAECIDLIAESVGVGQQVSAITEAAMRGELDFTHSLQARVGLLEGVDTSIYATLKSQIDFMPGAKELAAGLRSRGIFLAVLSGGFVPIAEWVKATLEFDHAHANVLEERDGKLTGKTIGSTVDGQRKAELLQAIAQQHSVSLSDVVAIGDGSNDLPMMGVAGFGVAFNAKPLVQRKAPARLNSGNLSDILYLV